MKRSFGNGANKSVSDAPAVKFAKPEDIITVEGGKYVDSGGGFLLDAEVRGNEEKQPQVIPPIGENDEYTCRVCSIQFSESYLFKHLDLLVCDLCRPSHELDLITKSRVVTEYLLTDEDLEKREPPLKFFSRPNPYNERWGQMKLYLKEQVEARALEKWGTMEALEEALLDRESKRLKNKTKQRQKKIDSLRKTVRSSLFKRETSASHEHTFSSETYDSDEDMYSRKCDTCGFVEKYEKM